MSASSAIGMRGEALRYYARMTSISPRAGAQAAIIAARRGLGKSIGRRRDAARATFAGDYAREQMLRYWSRPPRAPDVDALRGVTENYLAHRFDLLGSGWVQVKHAMHCRGVEGLHYAPGEPVRADRDGAWLAARINPANLKTSQYIWRLIDEGYAPLDWQLDFKSGYRWSERTWYRDLVEGHQAGADAKVPWELARMQHAPQLALAYACAAAGVAGFRPAQSYLREFRNQVLDFISTNPPRFGINWRFSMDAGIRAVNWLIAYDLFQAAGGRFDAEFAAVLARSVYEHGRHIVANLEWYGLSHANHYLANVAGLLFIAAYLPRSPQSDAWLAFAIQELINEVQHQFGQDGGNFEASTSYHGLAAEMVAYATALTLGLSPQKLAALREYDWRLLRTRPPLAPGPLPFYSVAGGTAQSPFPSWYVERLEKMAEFTLHLTKPNGAIAQIGDNDSGRFLKLAPRYLRRSADEALRRYANLDADASVAPDAVYWDEAHLDHRHLVAAINGLFGRDDFAAFAGPDHPEGEFVSRLARGRRLPSYRRTRLSEAAHTRVGKREIWQSHLGEIERSGAETRHEREIALPGGDLRSELTLFAYPDFGLYIFRSRRLYLAVRCGSIDPACHGAHAHNDQLSIELNVDAEDRIADPGTYLYTPLPRRRNAYRSVDAHFAPRLPGREPSSLAISLFKLHDTTRAQCLYFGEEGFVGVHYGYGFRVRRVIEIQRERLRVLDSFDAPNGAGSPGEVGPPPFSPAYGVVLRR